MITNLRHTTERNSEQDWLKTNLARVTGLLQGQRDLGTVGKLLLSDLTPLVSAQLGVIYLMDAEDRQHGLARGAFSFITKPATPDGLKVAFSRIKDFASPRQRRSLVVEDDAAEQLSIRALLEHNDIEMQTVSSGEEALAALKERTFDCVVLDLRLPDISGFDVLERLSENDSPCVLPTVVFTGKELTPDEDARLHSIARSIVVKGVESPERLLEETALFLHRVVASAWMAQRAGLKRAISFDMGGTSTDVCLLAGPPRTTNETSLAGLPVAVPVLDVHSVGAGGGSLARIDAGGALRVGPESAGASPGPVCYGRGGAGLTVTDANLILGRLDPEHFLGGTFKLDAEAARRAFEKFLAGPARHAGFASAPELAAGIVAASNATMEKALRVISVERGYDPRDFSLICYGGAGGLHAADLARALGMSAVIVPRNPGAFSALGILLSDVVRDVSQSVLLPLPVGVKSSRRTLLSQLDGRFQRLHRLALAELRGEGFDAARARASRRLDVRYQGQSYELSVPFTPGFGESFHREHAKAYGYSYPERSLEVVNLRLRMVISTPKSRGRKRKLGPARQAQQALTKTKPVWFGAKPHPTGIYDRERLAAGAALRGPAVIVEYSATTVVPPDFACKVDEHLNLVLEQQH